MTPREALQKIIPLCEKQHPEALLQLEKAVHAAETIDGKRFLWEQERLMRNSQAWQERYHHEEWMRQKEHGEAWAKIRALECQVQMLGSALEEEKRDAEEEARRKDWFHPYEPGKSPKTRPYKCAACGGVGNCLDGKATVFCKHCGVNLEVGHKFLAEFAREVAEKNETAQTRLDAMVGKWQNAAVIFNGHGYTFDGPDYIAPLPEGVGEFKLLSVANQQESVVNYRFECGMCGQHYESPIDAEMHECPYCGSRLQLLIKG